MVKGNPHSQRLPRVRLRGSGTVFTGQSGSHRQSAAFASICVTPSGRWLCAFRAAPTKSATRGQHTLLTWSDDQGKTWRDVCEPFPPMSVGGKPGAIRSAAVSSIGAGRIAAALCWVDQTNPDVPFFNPTTEGLLDTRLLLSFSEDDGRSWSEPRLADTTPFNVPVPLTGPILRLPDGQLACQFELNKHYEDTSTWIHRSILMFSTDGGRTWPRHTVASGDPTGRMFYWDQRPAVLSDGRILDLFWTFDRQSAEYLRIHARESRDAGASWSEIWDTGVPGQPAPVVEIGPSVLAMPYVDRTASPAIKVRCSTDGGRTWPAETELSLYEHAASASQSYRKSGMDDAWAEMAKFSVGLPQVAGLNDGGAVVVYYAGPHTDQTSIRWARIEPER